MRIYYEDHYGTLYNGLAEEILPTLPSNSVNMVMTSPPYWQTRKYVSDNELGQESDYRDYIDNLCKIFDLLKSVLYSNGSLFVNLGDKYFSRNVGSGGFGLKQTSNRGSHFVQSRKITPLMKQGNLMQLPERFAIRMVDEYNWYLKHRIIWRKVNCFPTSNKKKFTLDYEFIFHFVLDLKNYYFVQQFESITQTPKEALRNALRRDVDNLKSPYKNNAPRVSRYKHDQVRITSQENSVPQWLLDMGRNKRSVWDISIGTGRGYSHTASYPVELCRTPILATCPEGGVVLDPFFGSGSTAIMAEKLNRRWIGIELSEKYCEEAIIRILKARGK